MLILPPSHLHLGLPSDILSNLPTETLYVTLLFPIRVKCTAHRILLDLATRIIETTGRSFHILIRHQQFSAVRCLAEDSSMTEPKHAAELKQLLLYSTYLYFYG